MSNFICRNDIYSINFILLTQFLESLTANIIVKEKQQLFNRKNIFLYLIYRQGKELPFFYR